MRVEHVRALEQMAAQTDDDWLAFMASHLLYVLYGRQRALDASRIDNEPVVERDMGEHGCLYARAGPHKNQCGPKRATEEKCVIAPARGLEIECPPGTSSCGRSTDCMPGQ